MTDHGIPSVTTLIEHLDGGAPALYNVGGQVGATIDVDPATASVGLRIPWDGIDVPDFTSYDHLATSVVKVAEEPWAELRLSGRPVISDGYRLLLAVLVRIQQDGKSFSEAVRVTVGQFDALLDEIHGPGREKEIGLWGELAMLNALFAQHGAASAIDWWQGPSRGEHDFTLPEGDLEVKTTSSERRIHWFSDPRQLNPTLGRPLWVVSIQVTKSAGAGARTLPEFVAEVQTQIPSSHSDLFLAALAEVGWSEEAIPLLQSRWRVRSQPAVFEVTNEFPAVTEARLAETGVPVERVVDLRQRISLDGLPEASVNPIQDLRFDRSTG